MQWQAGRQESGSKAVSQLEGRPQKQADQTGTKTETCRDQQRNETVDVMKVIVVATSVTRQYPHKASKDRHNKIKGRNCADTSSRALRETNTGAQEKST